MIETGLRVHSACWEVGARTLAMNSVALRWRVAPELVAAAVVRLLGPSPRGVARAQRGRLRGGLWLGHLLVAGLDVVLHMGWCIHTVGPTYSGAYVQARTPGTHCRSCMQPCMRDVGLGTVHRPGPHTAAAAACAMANQQP
jgi:hypothetical protein